MALKLIEILAEYGGTLAVILGVPYVSLCTAIVVLWRNQNKDKERLMKLIENKVEQDAKLEAAFLSLKEVIKSRN